MKRLLTIILALLMLMAVGCSTPGNVVTTQSATKEDVFDQIAEDNSAQENEPITFNIENQGDIEQKNKDNNNDVDNVYWTYDQEKKELLIQGKGPMPDPINIEERPFELFSNEIEKVIVQKGITRICDYAFFGFSNLKEVVLPDTVSSIGLFAFADTPWYNEIVPDENMNIVYNQFLLGCTYTPSGIVMIPDDIVAIADGFGFGYDNGSCTLYYTTKENKRFVAIDGVLYTADQKQIVSFPPCANVSSFQIPDTVTSIANYCFLGNSSIVHIELPDTIETIGRGAFFDCESLSTINLPNQLKEIAAYSFCDSGIKEITIPSTVSFIGSYAFAGTNIKRIILPDDVTVIQEGSFQWCHNLSEVILSRNTQEIGALAFSGCPLHGIILPASLQFITYGAIDGSCLNYTTDENGAYVANRIVLVGGNAGTTVYPLDNIYTKNGRLIIPEDICCIMEGSSGKPNAYDASNNSKYSTIDHSLYSADGKTLISICCSQVSAHIPEGVTDIRPYAMWNCVKLESLKLPNSLSKIGAYAFCASNDYKNTRFDTSIREITIPNSVTEIGYRSFYNLDTLTDIYFEGTPEEWERIYIFSGNDPILKSTIHFLDGSIRYGYIENKQQNAPYQ